MPTWGLIAEMTVGTGDRKHVEAYVLTHVEGSRDEALAELEGRARRFTPEHPRNPKRRRLFRDGDGFVLVIDGSWQSYSARFTVAELLEDSAAPTPKREPEPRPEREPRPEPADAVPPRIPPMPSAPPTRYADGVPAKPAWLGRSDLP
ncbi:hypothetical protein [Streptomyces violascens]|uniref:hypothetical protein n=1 Tax=Streptomyces violascens TaxID=67381 RepID=UPI0036519BB5